MLLPLKRKYVSLTATHHLLFKNAELRIYNKLPNYQGQMKKDLYKDIRLFLSAIIAVSLFFSCSSVPSGIAEEITYHGEQLHRYLTIIKDVTTKAEKSKDTITYIVTKKDSSS